MTERILSPRVRASKEEIVATYSSYAPLYAEVTLWEKEVQEIVVAKAEIQEGYRVLDAGCGPGTVVIKAAERVGASGKVYGVDLSEKMLEEAMKRAQNAAVQDRIELRKTDLYGALPFDSDFFDVVISTYVFDLIDTPDIPGVLGNLVRVLRPGGKIVLGNWTFGEGPHKTSSDLFMEVYEKIKVEFGCRPVYLRPYMEELKLKVLGREYISYDMSPRIARVLFDPLAQELKSVPEMEKKVRDIETFAFCSEVIWGTK